MNLACSYLHAKRAGRLQRRVADERDDPAVEAHTKKTDSIVITGGEPTLRPDIEELVEAARFECKYRSLLLNTNGTLLDRKPRILRAVTGLVVSLDALAADPTNPLRNRGAARKCWKTSSSRRSCWAARGASTISTVIEQWNVSEVERLLDLCGEQDLFLRRSPRRWRKCRTCAAEKPRIKRCRQNLSNGGATGRSRSTARRDDRDAAGFGDFQCLSDNVSPGVSERRCFLSLASPLRRCRKFAAGWVVEEKSSRANKVSMRDSAVPGICYCSETCCRIIVNDFWGLAGFIR